MRTDNGTEFVNKALNDYYESVGITHEKTVPRTPQQNGVVERRNRTLVEVAQTMLIFSKVPCIFEALCYPTNDCEDLGKLKAKADIGFFVGYAPNMKGYRIYNKWTRQIMETIHVIIDELTKQTALVHSSAGPAPNILTPGPITQALVNPTGLLVSIPIDQEAPSGSHSPSSSDHQSSSVHQGVAAEHSFEVNPFVADDPRS
ncbi:retrovirus-related pol polyprotein from transposon TNT 1-94 [Tanacetum coccineum]